MVCGLAPTSFGVTVTEHVAAFVPLAESVQVLALNVSGLAPASEDVNETVPVGLDWVAAPVSVTVTVTVLACPTTTDDGLRLVTVVVGWVPLSRNPVSPFCIAVAQVAVRPSGGATAVKLTVSFPPFAQRFAPAGALSVTRPLTNLAPPVPAPTQAVPLLWPQVLPLVVPVMLVAVPKPAGI